MSQAPKIWIKEFSNTYKDYYWRCYETGESQWTDPHEPSVPIATVDVSSSDNILPPHENSWTKEYSETHKEYYWLNTVTGETRWTDPFIADKVRTLDGSQDTKQGEEERPTKRVKITDTLDSISEPISAVKGTTIKVAIIVPFRDQHVEQKRSEHLSIFIPKISA